MVRPSLLESFLKGSPIKAGFLGELTNGFFRTIRDVYEYIGASIVGLLNWSGPSAIARLVMAVVVIPLNAVRFTWARPHVLIEGKKTLSPPVAHRDSASAIPFVVRLLQNKTSALYLRPNSVLGAFSEPMSLTQS